ncbi:MAG: class I tRNA ligase family protein, partial [Alphaproteobacteria bacterium]|nr:class I tRNA ligase family protein [Alphaproteobacteria bacterium]
MHELRFYNSRTRRLEVFAPLSTQVKMYVCGPTVYDYAHLGNARPVVVFDVVFRLLKQLYRDVIYVRNITDVDDKIMDAAQKRGISISQLTQETTAYYHADMKALNALPPTFEPRATDHITDMITMIETLIQKGFAYVAEGHVLFKVESYHNYGCLSNKRLDDLLDGARVERADYKESAADFVLWKPST